MSDLVLQETNNAHENVLRKTRKTLCGQGSNDSITSIGTDFAVQGPGSPELTEVENFLSELGDELDALAARKIRFDAHL